MEDKVDSPNNLAPKIVKSNLKYWQIILDVGLNQKCKL